MQFPRNATRRQMCIFAAHERPVCMKIPISSHLLQCIFPRTVTIIHRGNMETHWLDKKFTSVVRLPSLSKCSQFHVGFFWKTFDISQASMQIKVLSHALSVPLVWQITELLPVLKIGAENNKKLSNSTLFTLGQSIKRASSVNWMEI